MYPALLVFGLIYFLLYQNVIGGCLVASMSFVLMYSFYIGRKMIHDVDISFDQHKKIYRQGEKYQIVIEVPKQKIFETREIEVVIQYTSVIEQKVRKKRQVVLLQRRTDGKVTIEYELKYSDYIYVEIDEFSMIDLCGCFRFHKKVKFHEKILVFPKDYPIEYGEISDSIEEYGNIRLFGDKTKEKKTDVVIYLDLENVIYESSVAIRAGYMNVFYSISASLLKHDYKQTFLVGDERYAIQKWEDYLPLFQRVFEVLDLKCPLMEPENMKVITHAITTKIGLPIPEYYGKTIAVLLDEYAVDDIYPRTEFILSNHLKDGLFTLSL